jgi:hypothetical protein
MDLEILQQIQLLYTLWTNKQQTGTLLLSMPQLIWINSDGIEVDLTTLLQQTRTTPLIEPSATTKQEKQWLKYYDLGKQLYLNPDQTSTRSKATRRTAQRVYNFYQFIGEQHLGKHSSITPSRLYRLTNDQFEDLKLEMLTRHITFGGPQAGEGDDLSSI